ncbi:MAG: CPBP family intramembrane glutamic endopeptidase [Casimicrobiaceae bacterium]
MTSDALTRRTSFWVAYSLAAAVALVVAWRLFPLAIPLVHLDITLGRVEAIAKAGEIAGRLGLAPEGARTAARFAHDQETQNYVELEGGGKAAFAALVASDTFAPYWWEVRLFEPGETAEALVRFRPDGTPWGFARKLPESYVPADPAGLALDRDAARRLAEAGARDDWGVEFSQFELRDSTQQTRTTGRVDHGFVYQRTNGNIAESRFRLRLSVAGNALTEVTNYVFVPESFDRRYAELRSANDAIASAATLTTAILYGVGGCLLGVMWLLRRRLLLWRPALIAGLVVGGLLGAAAFAQAPAAWFAFDTAQSTTSFWLRQIGAAALATVGGGLMLALVFMAAESLSRCAFPDHPQLWRVWSRDAAPTTAILGRTIGGYLFVPLELALVAAFYYATNRYLGWWQPSESLTDPNILGSAVPALAPIANSLLAGSMEECLFRAVPLSLAALIGQRYGHRGAAIALAMVVQALVFGGGHANYPGFPSYSRLVELFVPAILWGLVFLRFGLVPTIVLHTLFDLALMSIPLFVADTPDAQVSRVLVIAAGLVPLAIVIGRRMAGGAWGALPGALRNGAWRPSAAPPTVRGVPAATDSAVAGWVAKFQRALPALGAAGLAAWALATPFRADVPGLALSRDDVLPIADAALASRGVTLSPEWRRASMVLLASDDPGRWQGHKFVWREAGRDAYAKLVGTTLPPPLWDIRYARFDGDVAERAEEWRVTIDGRGVVRQIKHLLPESRPGAHLAQAEAEALARRTVRERFGLDPSRLKDVGTREKQLPNRADWEFTFAEPDAVVGADGEARVVVSIAGDEIAGYGRYVLVPEEWQRADSERDGRTLFMRMALAAVLGISGLAALVMAVIDWAHHRRDTRALGGVAAIAFAASVVGAANMWPVLAMGFSTTEPVVTQAVFAFASALAGGLVAALLLGLAAGVGAFAATRERPRAEASRVPAWTAGVAAACFVAGVGAIAAGLLPQSAPRWPAFGVESLALPWLGAALAGTRALFAIGVALYLLHWLGQLTGGWQRRGWLAACIAIAIFATLGQAGARDALVAGAAGALEGAAMVAVVYALLRFDALAVPAFVATGAALDFVEGALRKGGTGALVNAAIAIVVTVAVAWAATIYLQRARERAAASDAATLS